MPRDHASRGHRCPSDSSGQVFVRIVSPPRSAAIARLDTTVTPHKSVEVNGAHGPTTANAFSKSGQVFVRTVSPLDTVTVRRFGQMAHPS